MKRFLLFLMLSFVIFACNKDKFETKPQLRLKSRSGNVIDVNQIFQVVFEYTDKEGDVSGHMVIEKERLNRITAATTLRDSFDLKVPNFPPKDHGEITLNLEYQRHLTSADPPPADPNSPTGKAADTLRMKFFLRDIAGNLSDSVVVEPVIIIRR